jgi:hypothetical protein
VHKSLPTIVSSVAVALAAGCAGYASVDGYDAAYIDNPPAGIEYYPRYAFHDGYVYDVRGHYYHQHDGRWVVYRNAPVEIAHAHPVVHDDRGRMERQR